MDAAAHGDLVLAGLLIVGMIAAAVGVYAACAGFRRRASRDSARYAAVVDTAVDPIAVIDATGTIQSFNAAAERTFGYRAEEVIGRNVAVLMGEPHRSRHDAYLQHYLETGEARIIGTGRVVDGLRKDGTTFPLELSVGAWTAGGQRFFTGIMRDITERKRAEEAVRRERDRAEAERNRAEAERNRAEAERNRAETERNRAEAERARAERADRAKSNFLAAASHDLRQPVQSLIFQAHALGRRIDDPALAPILSRLNESLDGLRALLDGLLDMSRLEAGSVAPQRKDIDLAHLLARLAADLRPQAESKALRLRAPRRPAWTHSDPVLLERMLRNLMENAVRHTRRGAVLLGVRPRGSDWRIDVLDTGDGIPIERAVEIFDEFVQLDAGGGHGGGHGGGEDGGDGESETRQGLGLGLAIVQRLSALLGHPVEMASRHGRGTRFSVRVPRLAAPVVTPDPGKRASPLTEASGNGGGRVLVIEDEALIALGLRDLLESWGHEVTVAGSSSELLRAIKTTETPPVAILSDYRLDGGETGADAVRMLRMHFGTDIPALIMTGDTAPERLRALQGEGLDVLHKPVTPQVLAEGLKRLGR